MYVEIITPDRRVYAGEATSVRFPGSDGSFEVLNNHAAMIAALGRGDVRILTDTGAEKHIHIDGGVVEVLRNQVSVLAEAVISNE
ncbi:F-type H+-transporting ATPase subunit epsilon [Catalinimonas alkaloidigena]|uniref:F-type H+-transporting ATPase subunit epsilon n=1 Tax=Catalinimonas alkaloidigena TaxID=1075417 RepID=A0A1G9LVY6_9BACT|nr:ATP synthase F1 subunit epsilon [Catalinimonas alkaloidigena]SDL65595.1 F-type H+-transporting ATPase subunit epsilon [Catalinimonas alkaloidigena]